MHAACNVVRLYKIPHVEGVKRNINKQNRLDLRHLFLMSKMLKAHATCWMLHPTWYITRKYPMSKVLKEIKTSIKITFETFISHVERVKGSVHNIH